MKKYYIKIENDILTDLYSYKPSDEYKLFNGDYRDLVGLVGKEITQEQIKQFEANYQDKIRLEEEKRLEEERIRLEQLEKERLEEEARLKAIEEANKLNVPISKEPTKEELEALEKEQVRYALRREIESIKTWFKEHDWYINKVFLGEWEESEPRYIWYLKERALKRARFDELESDLEK